MPKTRAESFEITAGQFAAARSYISQYTHHTPLLTSHQLSAESGFDVHLKAELFQRTGSYKIRGALNRIRLLTSDERRRGVICSSAGNHAQGVALAAAINGIRAVVVMAENATPSKISATRGYGAEVILHGTIWDEANQHAQRLVGDHGYTYLHPFDDLDLIAGQGTVGLEILDDCPDVDVVIVPIGGGGLISGIAQAIKLTRRGVKVIGVESSGAAGMKTSIEQGRVTTLDAVDSVVDGLRVKRVGETTFRIVQRFVDEIVTVPDSEILSAVVWIMGRLKLVTEGAAAATVAAVRNGLVRAQPGARVVCVLSGGNLDVEQFRNLRLN